MKNPRLGDYDYIIKIIEYLETEFKISFFITSKDFDVLYKWWEKNIPVRTIEKSISNVCERWGNKGRKIYSFSNFSYEVRKNHKMSLELNVNVDEDENADFQVDKVKEFLKNFHSDLLPLKSKFKEVVKALEKGKKADLEGLYDELLSLFNGDKELEIRKKIFLRNIIPGVVNSDMERKFKVNYLKKKYGIPDFELLRK